MRKCPNQSFILIQVFSALSRISAMGANVPMCPLDITSADGLTHGSGQAGLAVMMIPCLRSAQFSVFLVTFAKGLRKTKDLLCKSYSFPFTQMQIKALTTSSSYWKSLLKYFVRNLMCESTEKWDRMIINTYASLSFPSSGWDPTGLAGVEVFPLVCKKGQCLIFHFNAPYF